MTKAPIHRGRGVTEWFEGYEYDENHMLWPSQSPDPKPTEHLREILDKGSSSSFIVQNYEMKNPLRLQTNLIHFLILCNPFLCFPAQSSHNQGFHILFSFMSSDFCLVSISQFDLLHLSSDLIVIF